MTISSTANKSGPYIENGVTTEFAYEFKIEDAEHIQVVRAVGVFETSLELGTDYTVTGVGNDTGNVVLSAPGNGSTLTLVRNVPFVQELELENQGAYFAEEVEAALDLAVARDQQLAEQLGRTIKVPVSSDATDLDALVGGVVQLLTSVDAVVEVARVSAQVAAVADISESVVKVAGIAAAVTAVSMLPVPFDTVASLLADTTMGYAGSGAAVTVGAGDIVEAQGFRYEVTAVGAYSNRVNNARGVELIPVANSEGSISLLQCGAKAGEANSVATMLAWDMAFARGGKVFIDPLPSGEFFWISDKNVPSGKELFGAGEVSRLKLTSGAKTPTIRSIGAITMTGSVNTYLHDFVVDGNKANVTGDRTNIEGINGKNCTNCLIENIRVFNAASDGIDWDDSTGCVARNCILEDCGGWGVHQSVGSVGCWTDGCKSYRCGFGGDNRGGFDVYVTARDGRITGCEAHGCYDGIDASGSGAIVIGNVVRASANSGIRAGGAKSLVANNFCFDSVNVGIVVPGADCNITGNTVDGANGLSGIYMTGSGSSAQGNSVFRCKTGIIAEGASQKIVGNTMRANTVAGIRVGSGAAEVLVTGNEALLSENAASLICTNDTAWFEANKTGNEWDAIGAIRLGQKSTAGAVVVGTVVASTELLLCSASGGNTSAPFAGSRWRALDAAGGSGSPLADRVARFKRVQ